MLNGDYHYEGAEEENCRSNHAPKLRATLNAGTICKTQDGTHINNPHAL